MSGAFVCGACGQAVGPIAWHCRGCDAHVVITNSACVECGDLAPWARAQLRRRAWNLLRRAS